MNDVAALARVSQKTVSRVVAGVATVDPELVERVNRAIDMLGFRPNLAASALARTDGRSNVIGVLVEDAGNPFFATMLRAVEDLARERGVDVLIGSIVKDPVREQEMILALTERRIDGLLLVPETQDQSYLRPELEQGLPVVLIDRDPVGIETDCVLGDNVNGARNAIEQLIAGGHRRIGYLGGSRHLTPARDRFAGYCAAIDDAGIALDEDLVAWAVHRPADSQRAAERMVGQHGATALFAAHNLITEGAVRALATMGVQHQIALIGYDDFPLAEVLDPAVTTVAQRPAELGRLAAELLFARIDRKRTSCERTHVPTDLIKRGSGEITFPPMTPILT